MTLAEKCIRFQHYMRSVNVLYPKCILVMMGFVSSPFDSLHLIDSRRGCAEVTAQIPAEMCTAKGSLMYVVTI